MTTFLNAKEASRRCVLARVWGAAMSAVGAAWPGLGRGMVAHHPQAQSLPTPTAMRSIHVDERGRLWSVCTDGHVYRADLVGKTAAHETRFVLIARDVDPEAEWASGHGRVVNRRADGALWVWEAEKASASVGVRLQPKAGLVVLPFGVIAVAGGATNKAGESSAHVVRLEPSGGSWRETARSAAAVVPDARPVQVALEAGGGDGHIVVLAGPDAQRYRHGVLGDTVEATQVLYLERHSLEPLRQLSLSGGDVFEDNSALPCQLDGQMGVVVVRSNAASGARLDWITVQMRDQRALSAAASGAAIGQGRRWMAPTTDGQRLVACHTPHIGGQLFAYQRQGDQLVAQRIASDVSSHRMGDAEVSCAAWGPSGLLWMPSQDRLKVHALAAGARGGPWRLSASVPVSHPVRCLRAAPAGASRDALALLDNGAIVALKAA